MGSEISSDERELRYKEFHNAIHIIDKDIKKELFNSEVSKKKYLPFGLVNKGLCRKYKFLGNEAFDKNQARDKIFNYNDLSKKNVKKNFSHIIPNVGFSFPSDFIFVNKDFLDVVLDFIDKKYKGKLITIFNTIIGGGCLIMRDAHDKDDNESFRYIILYQDIQENQGNEIDFLFYIKDKKERQAVDNYILQHDLLTYFEKIKYNYKDEYRKIYNDKKQEIGLIVRCCDIFRIETYLAKIESLKPKNTQNNPNMNTNSNINPNNADMNVINNMNLINNMNCNANNISPNINNINSNSNQMNFNNNMNPNNINNMNQNANNINPNVVNNMNYNPNNMSHNGKNMKDNMKYNSNQKKIQNFATNIPRKTYAKDGSDILLNPVLSYFFKIDELKTFFGLNKNVDFLNFKNYILRKVDPNIYKFQTYDKILEELLTKLVPNSKENKEYYNQSEQYDEEKGLKNFLEKFKKNNIIQKFFIPKEEKISCKKCGMNTFQFYIKKYIFIQNHCNETIIQKLFNLETETKKDKSCNFCNGQITDIKIERKTLDLPEILIVIISPYHVNNFSISNNKDIKDGMIAYKLDKFIEFTNNSLYWVNDKDRSSCHKCEINRYGDGDKENVDNKKPIVLFYNLIKQNNFNGQIKTIDVLNANSFNNGANQQANVQNMNQQKNQTNINKNNNFQQQNINQQKNQTNISKVNNFQQNMKFPQLNPQMINQQNNFQNFNPQQNNQIMNQQFNQKFNPNPQAIINKQNNLNTNNNQIFMNNQNNFMNNMNNNFGNNMNQFNNMNNNIPMNNNINMNNMKNMNNMNNMKNMNNMNNLNNNMNNMNNMNNNMNNMNNMNNNMNNMNNMNNLNNNMNSMNNMNNMNNNSNKFIMNNNNGNVFFQQNPNNINNNNIAINNTMNNNNQNNNKMMNNNMNNNNMMNNNMMNNNIMNNNMVNNNTTNNNMMNNNMINNNNGINNNNNFGNGNNNMQMNNNMNMQTNNNMNMQMNNNMNIQMNNNMNMQMNNNMNMQMNNNMNFGNNAFNNANMSNNNVNMINNNMNFPINNNMNNNINFGNNNFNNNMNMGQFLPQQNITNNNQNQNKSDLPPQNTENTIFVTFTFKKNKKQIYIDVDKKETFLNALKILEDKYEWLKTINKKKYCFNNKIISNYQQRICDIGIDENSDIFILTD